MSYAVKEVYYSLQGEGGQCGSPAVFCRFVGCNLWSGQEKDRLKAICKFCDTNFLGTNGENGAKYETAQELAAIIHSLWPQSESPQSECQSGTTQSSTTNSIHTPELTRISQTIPPSLATESFEKCRLVIFTGGEPLLQLDSTLISAVKDMGFRIGVESNGTVLAPDGIDWLTISPKTNATLIQKSGTELKLVYPQQIDPQVYTNFDFKYFYLSPLTTDDQEQTRANLDLAIEYCLEHPTWKLTYQYHKFWNKR